MNELYWIFTIGKIGTIVTIIAVLVSLFSLYTIVKVPMDIEVHEKDEVIKEDKKIRNISTIIAVFLISIAIFTPSTRELISIYSIGGTVDFIQDNDTAKELPDKCIQAVDIFLDKYIETDNPEEDLD